MIFVEPAEQVYTGQIVGENSRGDDLECNPTRRKNVTNHRSATKEITTTLDVPRKMSLEQAMGWLADDELMEVTPASIRMRKAILDSNNRRRAQKTQLPSTRELGASSTPPAA